MALSLSDIDELNTKELSTVSIAYPTWASATPPDLVVNQVCKLAQITLDPKVISYYCLATRGGLKGRSGGMSIILHIVSEILENANAGVSTTLQKVLNIKKFELGGHEFVITELEKPEDAVKLVRKIIVKGVMLGCVRGVLTHLSRYAEFDESKVLVLNGDVVINDVKVFLKKIPPVVDFTHNVSCIRLLKSLVRYQVIQLMISLICLLIV